MASLTGSWKDDQGNTATVKDTSGSLTFDAISTVWWKTGSGSWKEGTVAADGDFAGSATFSDGSANKQELSFCVAANVKSIVFANGVTWKLQ